MYKQRCGFDCTILKVLRNNVIVTAEPRGVPRAGARQGGDGGRGSVHQRGEARQRGAHTTRQSSGMHTTRVDHIHPSSLLGYAYDTFDSQPRVRVHF